jgi:predicted PurR-regulated permease PerM
MQGEKGTPEEPPQQEFQKPPSTFARIFPRGSRTRAWVAGAILLGFAVIFWRAFNIFFLFFLSVLFALVLRGISDWTVRVLRVPKKWSLTLTVLVLLLLFSALGWAMAAPVSKQFFQLQKDLPRAVNTLRDNLNRYPWGRQITSTVEAAQQQPNGSAISKQAARIVSSTLTILGAIFLVAVIAIYLAADPCRYVNSFIRLFPPPKRKRLGETFEALGTTLQRGMIGQFALMGINGIVTSVALWLLGIPLALALGVISAILNFIPNFGPILAAVPAVLIASLQGFQKAVYVAILYFIYQMIDGYVFTPLVQKRAVSVPAALVLMAQVLFGVLFGTIGVLVAVPFTAMLLVLTKMLYVEDVLREDTDLPGEKSSAIRAFR